MSGTTPTPAAPRLAPGFDNGISDSDGITNINVPTLVGTTVPDATVTFYDSDGVSVLGSGTANAQGFYTIALSQQLSEGGHLVFATATAPNAAASAKSAGLPITVDTMAPDMPAAPILSAADDTGLSAEDGITTTRVLQFTGLAEPGSTVALFNTGNTTPLARTVAASDGSYTLTTGTLSDATYSFIVSATDVAGNLSKPSAATAVTIDNTAPATPAAPTLSPGTDTGVLHSDGLTDDNTPVVVGSTEANATVELFDAGLMVGKGTADSHGHYAIATAVLPDGAHALSVEAVDAAGNTSAASASLDIVADTASPTGTSTPEPAQAIFGSVPFELHFSEAVTGLTVSSLKVVGTGTATGEVTQVTGSGDDYTVIVDGLSGAGTLGLAFTPGSTVTDAAGNAARLTASTSYAYLDQNAPQNLLVGSYTATDTEGLAQFYGTTGSIGLSGGGRLVSFDTDTPATTSDTNPGLDVYVKDMRTGGITLISAGVDGDVHNGDSGYSSLSASGSVITFVSTATGLVPDGPTDGLPNLYAAHLSTSSPASGEAVTMTDIQLVSENNGQDGITTPQNGEGLFSLVNIGTPALSADGTHVVFGSDTPLIDGVTPGISNIYEEDLDTGVLSLVSVGAGQGGNAGSDHPSVSADGSTVTYESAANNLGGTPVPDTENVYVYNVATNTTTMLDAATSLGLRGGGLDVESYGPQINSLGTWVTYTIQLGSDTAVVVNQNIGTTGASAGKIELLTPDTAFSFDDGSSVSQGGRYVAYELNDDGIDTAQPPDQVSLVDSLTGTRTVIGPGVGPAVSSDGNAIAYSDPSYTTSGGVTTFTGGQIVLTTLGPTVGIDPVDGNGELDQAEWRQATSAGLVVTGVTDAGSGATVRLQLLDTGSGAVLSSGQATLVGDGGWSITLPGSDLFSLPDGTYRLNAIASAADGASFPSNRSFTVDTGTPATPDAPKLDAGSDTSPAGDGSATSQDTPILTGTAEAGATITLYDTSGATPTSAIGTATADSAGVYAVEPTHGLTNGRHTLALTATDAAGNVSATSAGATFTFDDIAPEKPDLALSPGSDTGPSATDGITSNAGPTVLGTAEAGSTITLYDTDGLAVLGTTTVKADGTWSLDSSSLSDGTHSLTATDTDEAGNVSPRSTPLVVTVDTTPPFAPLLTSVNGATSDGSFAPLLEVEGTAEPGSVVTLQLDGGNGSLGQSTTSVDGEFSIDSDPLPAGTHMLSVIATDVASNASEPSTQTQVTITGIPAPLGGSPFTAGIAEDGLLVGSTVFADANNNGVLDAGEISAATDTKGAYLLATNAVVPLVLVGGADSVTGLTPPGELEAPGGSTVITPITTLLEHLGHVTGTAFGTALNQAAAQALGLDPTIDLATLDPDATAAAGDPTGLIASARLMDTAVTMAETIAAQTGVTRADAFSAAFDAIARAAAAASPISGGAVHALALADATAAPTLDLDDAEPISAILVDATNAAQPGAVLPAAVLSTASDVIAAGNAQLDSGFDLIGGATHVDSVETVEQGLAAPALAVAGDDAGALTNVEQTYTGYALASAVGGDEPSTLPAPALAPGQDAGRSAADNAVAITTPTFIGTAPPGTEVALLEESGQTFTEGTVATVVVGLGVADALGAWRITSTVLPANARFATGSRLGAVAVGTFQSLTVGEQFDAPAALPVLEVTIDPTADAAPSITDATAAPASDDTATATRLYVYGAVSQDYEQGATISVFADGGPTPIATSDSALGYSEPEADVQTVFGLTTSPLSVGQHVLSVTATLPGGTILQGASSFTVDVPAVAVVDGTGSAIGALIGAHVYYASQSLTGLDQSDTVETLTGAAGTYAAAAAPSDAGDLLMLTGGFDAVTGLPLGGALAQSEAGQDDDAGAGTLLAPAGSAAITPLTSIEALIGEQDPTGNAEATTLAGLGLPAGLDLATLDPLAAAEAGDVTPFLVDAKLLDTVTMLAPFIGFSFAPIVDLIVQTGSIDLDSASAIAAALAAAYPYGITDLSTAEVQVLAGIVAAGNQAIDSHAAASISLADTLSYTLAAMSVAQEAETTALQAAKLQGESSGSLPDLDGVVADYTGAALASAIAGARADAAQATGFVAAGPLVTGAPSVDFVLGFGQAVSGLAAADFGVVAGGDLTGAHVTGVRPLAGNSYDITVATGAGQGTLALSFDGNGLLTGAGQPLSDPVFEPAQEAVDALGSTGAIATGDFNGDGRPDVVTDNSDGDAYGSLTVFLNHDGTLVAEAPVASDATGLVAVGDLNGDGRPDIVTTGALGLSVLLGNGDGSFGAPITTAVPGEGGNQVVFGDFNGDGRMDVAVSDGVDDNGNGGSIAVLLGNGDGTFGTPSFVDIPGPFAGANSYPVGQLATADLNHDGHPDLVATLGSAGTDTVAVFLGRGDGTFQAGQVLAVPNTSEPGITAVSDVDGDGIPDIVSFNSGDGIEPDGTEVPSTLSVLLGNGDGTFRALAPESLPGSVGTGVAIGDLDGDGHADLLLSAGYDLQVLRGNGDGTFTPEAATDDRDYEGANGGPGAVLTDINGDGRPDVLVGGSDAAADEAGTQYALSVLLNTPEPVLGSTSQAITISRPALADPVLSQSSGVGTLTRTGNSYTLDLGTVSQGSAVSAVLALVNAAAAPADSFDGSFSAPGGSGFTMTGDASAAPVPSGASSGALTFTADTSATGSHAETLTFAPRDVTAVVTSPGTLDGADGGAAPSAAADPDAVAAELPAITLTVTDVVQAAGGTEPPAALGPLPAQVTLPAVHADTTDLQPLTISNIAAAGAAALDATGTATGNATVSGSVTGLAPQSTDSSLSVGLDTSTAGLRSGTVTIQPVSEPDDTLGSSTITVSGAVYRLADAAVDPVSAILHVGDAGILALLLRNVAAADGYSEAMTASLASISAGIGIAAGGVTGDIEAGGNDTSLAIAVSTAVAGTIAGTATLAVSSDGGTGAGSLDGLGVTALPSVSVPVEVTVDNLAVASLAAAGTVLTSAGTSADTVIDLGTISQGASVAPVQLDAFNSAAAPADMLDGSYTVTDDSPIIADGGFGSFSDLDAGGSTPAGTISVDTSQIGAFSETVVLHPIDTNAAGYSQTLADRTVTIEGAVAASGTASGDVHLQTFDGQRFDFQAIGDFVLARSIQASDPFQVQIRTAAFPIVNETSVTTEIAARVGSDVVTFRADGSVAVNGIADTALDAAHPVQLLAAGTLTETAGRWQLAWASGEDLSVTAIDPATQAGAHLDLTLALGPKDGPGSVEGVLGNFTGAAVPWGQQGTMADPAAPSPTALAQFADPWRVQDDQSLLSRTSAAASGAMAQMRFIAAGQPGSVLTGSLDAPPSSGSTFSGTAASLAGDVISNLSPSDRLDIGNVSGAIPVVGYAATGSGGQISIADGSHLAVLQVVPPLATMSFHTAPDQHGGLLAWFA